MADRKDAAQRRVYVLPAELVERVVEFQNAKNLPSEVEAVRRLLDEALKHRDTGDAIMQRMVDRIAQVPLVAEAARDILVGHPLLESIAFNGESVTFELKQYGKYRLNGNGEAFEFHAGNLEWYKWPIPKNILDDELPF